MNNKMEPQERQDTTIDDIPPERLSDIFEHLSFKDKVNVSQVSRRWTQVAKYLPALRFVVLMDNESLKFVAERFCPLDILRIENWTSILRQDYDIQELLTPVNKLELGEGISRHNMNLLLQTEGGSVKNLMIYMRFFANRYGVFPSTSHPFKWNSLQTLNLEIPGGNDPADFEHLTFMTNLFNNANLPCLMEFAVEMGRKIGSEASRVNRNGRFYPNTLTPLIEGIFNFIASHRTTLTSLKLYFILNVYPEDGETISNPECSTDLGKKLAQLNLTKVQIRFYFDDRDYKIPFVRHVLNGSTLLTHIEFELFRCIYPEIYTTIERNADTLQTVILEIRAEKNPARSSEDVFIRLDALQNCKKLKTLHLRDDGPRIVNLQGLPTSISTLRICFHESFYDRDHALDILTGWIRGNLPELEYLEFGDVGMGDHVKVAAFVAGIILSRYRNFKSSRYMSFNWYGDYIQPEPVDSLL